MKSGKRRVLFILLSLVMIISVSLVENHFRGNQVTKEKKMSTLEDILSVIDEAIDSLSQQPNQFALSINITGTTAMAQGGGTGLSVTAVGGGPGSSTIGFQSSIDGAQIQAAQSAVNNHLISEADKAIQILRDLKTSLSSKNPEGDKVSSLLSNLKESYLPPIVTSIIVKLISFYLGM